jgi:hypothetical protein
MNSTYWPTKARYSARLSAFMHLFLNANAKAAGHYLNIPNKLLNPCTLLDARPRKSSESGVVKNVRAFEMNIVLQCRSGRKY